MVAYPKMLRRSLLTTLCVAAFAHGLAWVNGSSARALKNHHEHHLRHEWKPGESEASGKRFPWRPTPYDPATEPLEVVRQAMKGTDVMSDSVCASIPEFVLGTSPAHFPSPRPGRRRLAWFMSMSKPNDAISRAWRARACRSCPCPGRGEGAREGLTTDPFLAVDLPNARPRARPFAGTYLDFVKATTLSAKLNAPSLVPYFLYVYLPDQEFGEEDDLTRWLTRMGTRVVPWRLSFYDRMPPKVRGGRQGHLNVGCFGRLDIPAAVTGPLAEEFAREGLDADYVLYTDTDVLFAGDWPSHEELLKARASPQRAFARASPSRRRRAPARDTARGQEERAPPPCRARLPDARALRPRRRALPFSPRLARARARVRSATWPSARGAGRRRARRAASTRWATTARTRSTSSSAPRSSRRGA